MKKEKILLDGKDNGFAVYNLVSQEFIKNKHGEVLFRNIDLAKTYAANVRKLLNPYDYDLYISLYGSFIPYDNFEKVDDCYQLYAECNDEEVKYFVKPIVNRHILKIGYLVINNGERIFDKDKGVVKSNTYYKAAIDSISNIIKVPNLDPGIVSINKDLYGVCASIKNSTARIHVCYNSQIMTVNQARKANNLRALRFDKDMDKYTTLYVFIDIDKSEPEWFEGISKAEQVCNTIANTMIQQTEEIASCEFKEIDLLNPIFLEEETKKDFMKKG